MGTTALLVFAMVTVLTAAVGSVWILRSDAVARRRTSTDLQTCEAIWALTVDR